MISIELCRPSITNIEESRGEQMVWYIMVWYDINRSMTNIEESRGE